MIDRREFLVGCSATAATLVGQGAGLQAVALPVADFPAAKRIQMDACYDRVCNIIEFYEGPAPNFELWKQTKASFEAVYRIFGLTPPVVDVSKRKHYLSVYRDG